MKQPNTKWPKTKTMYAKKCEITKASKLYIPSNMKSLQQNYYISSRNIKSVCYDAVREDTRTEKGIMGGRQASHNTEYRKTT